MTDPTSDNRVADLLASQISSHLHRISRDLRRVADDLDARRSNSTAATAAGDAHDAISVLAGIAPKFGLDVLSETAANLAVANAKVAQTQDGAP